MLTSTEIARQVETDRQTVIQRLRCGELRARKTNDNRGPGNPFVAMTNGLELRFGKR